MTFFIATKNAHKLKELKRILAPMGIDAISEAEWQGELPEVEEDGVNFCENALLKAKAAAKITGLPCVADDSGLCVDALNGAPGIFSARFGGVHGDDAANNALLLQKLKDVPDEQRTAHFTSAVACVFPDGRCFAVEGYVYGKIGYEVCGSNGFGYDPLFISAAGCFGRLSGEQKDAISHRANALKKFSKVLKEYIE